MCLVHLVVAHLHHMLQSWKQRLEFCIYPFETQPRNCIRVKYIHACTDGRRSIYRINMARIRSRNVYIYTYMSFARACKIQCNIELTHICTHRTEHNIQYFHCPRLLLILLLIQRVVLCIFMLSSCAPNKHNREDGVGVGPGRRIRRVHFVARPTQTENTRRRRRRPYRRQSGQIGFVGALCCPGARAI